MFDTLDKLKYDLREIKIMSNLKSDYMVQYFDSWMEDDMSFTLDVLP